MLKNSLFYSCFWISLQIHNWDKWCHLVSGKAFVYKRQNAIRPLDTLVVNRRRSHIVHLLTWNHYFCLPLYLTFTSVFIHMNVYQCLYQLLRRIHKRWIGHIQLHFCRDRNFSSSLHHNLPKQRHCRLQFVWFTYLRIVRKKDYTF